MYLLAGDEQHKVSELNTNFAPRTARIFLQTAAGLFVAFCLTQQEAKAYADPGSGAVLWQLLFASIVSIGFHFRKLRLWFTSRRSRRDDT
ncbi:MAG TPA: hypothetical protein VGL72_15255 [Bryobacteraceae bacterium]|jgi:hypothetical protein